MRWLRRRRRWTIVTSAPAGAAGEQWGDTWFARDLVAALNRAGEDAHAVGRAGATSDERERDDVVLVLRGLNRVLPRRGRATWLLWVISHPELVDAAECAAYDGVFAASAHWSRADELGAVPLLQATDPARFTPSAATGSGSEVLFVGSTRGEFRPIVRDALRCGAPVDIYGVGWEAYVDPARIRGEFLSNAMLPAAYADAGVVLNDHWADMAREGFLSNRLFDAAATAAPVISDQAVGLAEVFGAVVRTYVEPDALCTLLQSEPPERVARTALAERIAAEHSFDARARVLIEQVERLR